MLVIVLLSCLIKLVLAVDLAVNMSDRAKSGVLVNTTAYCSLSYPERPQQP